MKRIFPLLLLLTAAIFLCSCGTNRSFVKVKGTNFTVKEKPYYFIGTNFWYGAYLGAEADYGNRARLLRELDHLQELGINNLRIMAASEESDFKLPLNPPFQYKNGEYNETLLEGLDFLLAEMGKRNLRAILVLNNYWEWSGGMSQYVSWETNETIFDPSGDKGHTWNDMMSFSARFYENEAAQKMFQKYISALINRKNTFSKKLYKNDPAIMTWELANEPRPSKVGDSDQSVKVFSKWVHDTAEFIKSLDTKHLVTTGSEGSKGTLNELDYAQQAHASEYIDYTTFHLWPKNWSWFDAEKPETIESTKKNTANYIAEHVEISRKLNKPSVLEEFGFVRDGEKFSPESPVTSRDEFYGFVLELLKDRIENGDAISGLNFWSWGGEGRAQQDDYMWKIGDTSFTGDPYGEAQGLNSIFDKDESTLKVISEYAKELEELSKK